MFRSRAKRAQIIKLKWILSENEIRLRPNSTLAFSESDSRNSARLSALVNNGMTPNKRRRTGRERMSRKSTFAGASMTSGEIYEIERERITAGSFSGSMISRVSSTSNTTLNDLPTPKSDSIITGAYLDGYVALKKLPQHYTSITDISSSKFNHEIVEIRELCKIQHSHLTKFYGVYKSNDQPASIVSEYGTKGSLKDLLEDKGSQLG